MTESKLIKRVVKGTDRENVFADVDINNQVSFLMTSFLIFSNFIHNEKNDFVCAIQHIQTIINLFQKLPQRQKDSK